MKCPFCGSSNAQPLNILDRVIAKSVGAVVGAVLMLFHRKWGFEVGMNLSHDLCRYAKYRCRKCDRFFEKER